jgi:hypothetical protein
MAKKRKDAQPKFAASVSKQRNVDFQQPQPCPYGQANHQPTMFPANECFFDDDEYDMDKGPMQDCVDVVDMSDLLLRLNGRKHKEWTEEEKSEVAAFMRNRLGICQSDHGAIRAAGLEEAWEHWDEQYTDMCFSDASFLKLLDPFLIVIEVVPVGDGALNAALNATNVYLGGGAVAGAAGQPIVFVRGQNWMLAVPNRITGQRALAHLHGQLDALGLFRAVLISYINAVVD